MGRIQDIIDEAQQSAREILKQLAQEMEEEKRIIRSNQVELITQLEDMRDTAKYMKLIEERNREIAKEKAKKKEKDKTQKYQRKPEKDSDFKAVTPDIKINEEYFEKAGLTPEGLPKETEQEAAKEAPEEKVIYEKPVIKINKEYFKNAGIPLEQENETETKEKEREEESPKEETRGFFLFGRKS